MIKKNKKILLSITAILFAGCLISLGLVYYYLFYPQFHPQKEAYIYIDRDDSLDSIYNKVLAKGEVQNFTGFKWIAKKENYAKKIHTGRYAIKPGDNAYHLFRRLERANQTPLNLTVRNVRTKERLARSIGKQLMIDSVEIASKLMDSTFCAKMGYNQATIICLFIPETYEVYWNISLDHFFKRMQKEHDKFWNKNRIAKAKAIGLTPEEVSTIASIVEEETNNNQEKPIVAGLYINRLHASMPLQADPTIKFALQDFGLRRILNSQLKIDSPYNTYRNIGLPPGPIRIPSVKGIDSVLNYVKHNYLYMCAKEDFSGTHNFASTYHQHMANARKYWQALNKRKIFQ
ncbi:endolytic transglycosylase MltG [uncultured Bacteroides sp.]|uniref:endolytic transglycosylase MltG n=1 Tax=uncultured Bacteroides sp. TaxID=162156 RepID=UPI002AAB39EE|nr:endolytic transglycosylase MltG [uncultured Bacteroides sp.]